MSKQPKSRGLGKGLSALIRTPEEMAGETQETSQEQVPVPMGEVAIDQVADGSGLRLVKVSEIRPNPHQPRTEFNQGALEELAASITEHGLIQPLIVSKEGKYDFILIAGERRWRASQLAGLEAVPAVVKQDVTALEMLELALIENIQREDLNAIEEGLAYKQLIDEFSMTQVEVAQRVGKGRSTITNTVRLLDLDSRVQQAIVDGEISGGHARALLGLPPEQQVAIMNSIIKNDLNVRRVEEIVRKLRERAVPRKKVRPELPPELADLEKQFSTKLSTRVEIERSKNGGRVVIHYYSDEELHGIYKNIIQNPDGDSNEDPPAWMKD